MKSLIVITILLLVTIAIAQDVGRTRVRGSRRFPLATPGLSSGQSRVANNEEENINSENSKKVQQPKRSRGSSLARRGRPLRLRKPNNQSPLEQAPIHVGENIQINNPTVPPVTKSASRIRLRRPSFKLTTTQAPITTTPSLPVENELLDDYPLLTDEELAQIIDEGLDREANLSGFASEQKLINKIENNNEKKLANLKEENINIENPDTEIPIKPKLRPIPIKLGRKGPTTNSETVAPVQNHKVALHEEDPSPHRFSGRVRAPRIKSRARSDARGQNNPPAQDHSIQLEKQEAIEPSSPQRSRGRSSFRLRSNRLGSRGQTVQQTPQSDVDTVDEEQNANSRRFGRRPIRG